MSKSRGNLVSPADAFELYGADALRLYMLFSGPPEQDFDWPEEGVTSIGRVTFPWLAARVAADATSSWLQKPPRSRTGAERENALRKHHAPDDQGRHRATTSRSRSTRRSLA